MKKKKYILWIILVVVGILLILGLLYSMGVISADWQPLVMIFAALAAPFTFFKNFISGKNVRTNKIMAEQRASMDRLDARRDKFQVYMKQKDERIEELEAEVEKLKSDKSNIELEMKDKEEEINNMTGIEDLQNAFMEGYSDES